MVAHFQITNLNSIKQQAEPAFYTENESTIADPNLGLQWLQKIGIENVKNHARIRIFVHGVYQKATTPLHSSPFYQPPSSPPWCKIFDKLTSDATGLRELYVYWDAEPDHGHFGGGDGCSSRQRIVTDSRLDEPGNRWVLRERSGLDTWHEMTGLSAWSSVGQADSYLEELRKCQCGQGEFEP